ncbi:apoptosis 2 inhibitor-like protein, partial [Dinothrombium tinctorium]
ENKVIVVASAKCSCCKYLVRNDFGIHIYDLVITPEERLEILKVYQDEEPSQMMFESERLATFKNWSIDFISKEDLAKAGFYFLNDGDRVKCHYYKGVIYKWEPGDKPLEEHKRHFPFCSYLKLLGCTSDKTS